MVPGFANDKLLNCIFAIVGFGTYRFAILPPKLTLLIVPELTDKLEVDALFVYMLFIEPD